MDRICEVVHVSPSCPRCGSSNTKFCYYNNYSLTQPRYFCKGCRRYWTKGGSLRNVPVGGGCRKIRRCRSNRFSTAQAASRASLADLSGSDIGSPASPEGSHIDLALVYANYLNHDPETKGELEMGGAGIGLDNQFIPSTKQVEPDIEFLSGIELIGCELLSNLFADTQFNEEDKIHHEGFGSADANHNLLLPTPNEEVVESWWLDTRTEMAMMASHVDFHESDFSSADFRSEGQDLSFVTTTWGNFDLPL
ncbi:hypothetical protein MLD38_020184 [Melastoma candidum]|uniref:Uncharacterized protein n=1 Tax=Melastoma candidum TaxID=119954 RepID=A0ACB9QCM0_9MYRT|nr:hypothetical protein MLD38_020184 [Melastoma candidum]